MDSRYEVQKVHSSYNKFLAVVVESEEAYQIGKVIPLFKWLEALDVKQMCLYDVEGVLKKSKKSIIEKLESAILLEECVEEDLPKKQKHMILEFASISVGKDMVAKATNLLFSKLAKTNADEAQMFTAASLGEDWLQRTRS